MPKLQMEMTVELDGHPQPYHVVADQRDLAQWEQEPFRDNDAPHLRARYLAWRAMCRQGLYARRWPEFNEHDCIEAVDAEPLQGVDPDDGDRLDPGNRETSA